LQYLDSILSVLSIQYFQKHKTAKITLRLSKESQGKIRFFLITCIAYQLPIVSCKNGYCLTSVLPYFILFFGTGTQLSERSCQM